MAAPTAIKMQLAGFGLMAAAQLASIARADAVTSVVMIIAAQLLGAAVFRALAVRRWRRIDWWQLQPLTRPQPRFAWDRTTERHRRIGHFRR